MGGESTEWLEFPAKTQPGHVSFDNCSVCYQDLGVDISSEGCLAAEGAASFKLK